jgi:hypothetical protein
MRKLIIFKEDWQVWLLTVWGRTKYVCEWLYLKENGRVFKITSALCGYSVENLRAMRLFF